MTPNDQQQTEFTQHLPRTMRAVVRREYGPAHVVSVQEVEVPSLAPDRVLVRVEAAGLDRGVLHLMEGLPYLIRPVYGIRTPRQPVLGRDVAGVVVAVGAEVEGFRPGDEVYGTARASFADFALARPGNLARKPANLTFEEAAAVPVSALTALQALRDRAKVQPGQRILVIGASGGVGTYTVQLAKHFGAEVTGVCSAAKVDLVRALGADHVIDYTTHGITDHGTRYDVVVDIGGSRTISELRRAMTPKGTLVIVGGEEGGRWLGGMGRPLGATVLAVFVGQRMGTFVASEAAADLDVLRELVEAGVVRVALDRVCGPEEVAGALADMAAGRIRGKAVVRFGERHAG